MLMASADDASVGRAFGLANGGGLAATVGVMFLVATVTDHSDTRYGFGALAAVALLATLSAGPASGGPVEASTARTSAASRRSGSADSSAGAIRTEA
ncbi:MULTISPECIES: hypothetical protein [unclassified Streptomyces]|nr:MULTISPECIES: hypothetical protein [unclassified Streptomyces]